MCTYDPCRGKKRKGLEDFREVKRSLTGMIYGSRRKASVRSILRIQVGHQVGEAGHQGSGLTDSDPGEVGISLVVELSGPRRI
jgi:hypothetical protein